MVNAVIFDLDGVLVTTDECHYQAWKQMADEEGIPFDRKINMRLRGVSRMDCLNIILEKAARPYTETQKQALADHKNKLYVKLINSLDKSSILPGAMETVRSLRQHGILTAIGSSSKNAMNILKRLKIHTLFDAVADGNGIRHSKPAPDVFLLAADLLHVLPEACLVVEDAEAGIEAAVRAGMFALGVGTASSHPKAHLRASTLADIDLLAWIEQENGTMH